MIVTALLGQQWGETKVGVEGKEDLDKGDINILTAEPREPQQNRVMVQLSNEHRNNFYVAINVHGDFGE